MHCRTRNRQGKRLFTFPSISFLGELGCILYRWHLVVPGKWIPEQKQYNMSSWGLNSLLLSYPSCYFQPTFRKSTCCFSSELGLIRPGFGTGPHLQASVYFHKLWNISQRHQPHHRMWDLWHATDAVTWSIVATNKEWQSIRKETMSLTACTAHDIACERSFLQSKDKNELTESECSHQKLQRLITQ